MKPKLKWLIPAFFVVAGVFAVIITPSAIENMLPEVATTFPEKREFQKTVKGAGVIYGNETSGFYMRALVSEKDINAVKIGQPAKLYGAAIGDGDYAATVTEISSAARRQEFGGVTETVVEVTLELGELDEPEELEQENTEITDNPKELLRSGYTAEALISVDVPRDILLIPYSAIAQDNEGEYVLILAGNTAIRRDIITGIELADGAEVALGVRESDELILKPETYGENILVKK